MLKSELKVGETYKARVSGNLVPVRLDEIVEIEGRSYTGRAFGTKVSFRAKTQYRCTNLKTGREIIVKSAARLRG